MLNFFDWIFSNRPLPHLVTLFQNGERASHVLTQLNNENEELKFRNRETNRQIKHLSTDYCNLISKLHSIHSLNCFTIPNGHSFEKLEFDAFLKR